MSNQEQENRLKDSREAAAILGISRRKLQRIARNGIVTVYKAGSRKLLFNVDEVMNDLRKPKVAR